MILDRERGTGEREKHWWVISSLLAYQGSNQQPFGIQEDAPTDGAIGPGQGPFLFNVALMITWSTGRLDLGSPAQAFLVGPSHWETLPVPGQWEVDPEPLRPGATTFAHQSL